MLGGIVASILMLAPFMTLSLAFCILVGIGALALMGRKPKSTKSTEEVVFGVTEAERV